MARRIPLALFAHIIIIIIIISSSSSICTFRFYLSLVEGIMKHFSKPVLTQKEITSQTD